MITMKFLVLALFPALALGQMAVGGISDTSVSATYEPVVFAVQAINNQFAASNGGQSPNLALLEVVKAKTQVVAGQKLFLTLHLTGDYYCDVTVWYRAWLKGDERMQVTDGPTCHQIARAMGGLGGQSQPKALDSTTEQIVNDALNFAVCASHDRSNAMFASVLGDTSGVTYTQQVTTGMTYTFQNVPLLETHCRNVGCAALDLTNCQANAHGMKSTCSFTVQSEPWMTPAFSLGNMACN